MGYTIGDREVKRVFVGNREVKSIWVGDKKAFPTDALLPIPFANYKFDGNALDSSGNNRHIVDGVTPQFTAGYGGKQALLGASYLDGGLICPFNIDNQFQNFAFICRFCIESYNLFGVPHYNTLFATPLHGYERPLMFNSDAYRGWWLYWSSLIMVNPYVDNLILHSVIPIETWNTIAITYNGYEISIFINAELKVKISAPPISSNWGALMIGSTMSPASDSWFNGKIQDVQIYDAPLADLQIIQIMNSI